jgi:hypothetical protein
LLRLIYARRKIVEERKKKRTKSMCNHMLILCSMWSFQMRRGS